MFFFSPQKNLSEVSRQSWFSGSYMFTQVQEPCFSYDFIKQTFKCRHQQSKHPYWSTVSAKFSPPFMQPWNISKSSPFTSGGDTNIRSWLHTCALPFNTSTDPGVTPPMLSFTVSSFISPAFQNPKGCRPFIGSETEVKCGHMLKCSALLHLLRLPN